MANEVHLYFFDEQILQRRQVLVDNMQVLLPAWLKQQPDRSDIYDILLKHAWNQNSPGVLHVTDFRRGVGVFPDLDILVNYYPSLKSRFTPIDNFVFDGIASALPAYTQRTDFPPGYTSFLSTIDYPGWQFFSYTEMCEMAQACEAILTHEASPYEVSWREFLVAHTQHSYTLALFTHEL